MFKMQGVEIEPFFLTPALISLTALALALIFRKRIVATTGHTLYISIIAFLAIYFLIVGSSLYEDIYYQWELSKYDLDKDGFFGSPKETTPEQQFAMQRLIDDTGRNLSVILGLIFSGIVSGLLYVVIWTYKKIRRASQPPSPQQNV